MMKKKLTNKGYLLVTLMNILFIIIIVSLILLVSKVMDNNKTRKIIESINVEYEFIGEVKINKDLAEPLKEFVVTYYADSTGIISTQKKVNYPVHMHLSHEKDKNYFEEIYNIEIPFEIDYSQGKIYVMAGSKIKSFKVISKFENELSEFKTDTYNTVIIFNDEYDANILYFYWIEDDVLYLRDELDFE